MNAPFPLRVTMAAAVAVVAGSILVACGTEGEPVQAPEIRILSSKAEYVSGGDALIEPRRAEHTTQMLDGRGKGSDHAVPPPGFPDRRRPPKRPHRNELIWYAREDSNLRPFGPQPNALSSALRAPVNRAGAEGEI